MKRALREVEDVIRVLKGVSPNSVDPAYVQNDIDRVVRKFDGAESYLRKAKRELADVSGPGP